MRTLKQAEASRRNGAKSRGPATPEGKANSARNALKHGLNSSLVVLNSESETEFYKLVDRCVAHYQPATEHEMGLVYELVVSLWRYSRVLALETATIDLEIDRQREEGDRNVDNIDEISRAGLAVDSLASRPGALAWLSRHEGRLRRAIREARAELGKCKKEPGNPLLSHDPSPVENPA